jgi:predicted dinucleotide-binding enzyme
MHSDRSSRRTLLALSGAALLASSAPGRAQPGPARLKIGMVGSGRLGSALGTLWVKAGHPVMFSSRHPEELKQLVQSLGPNASLGTPAEAIGFGDVVVIAVPYRALPEIGREYRDLLNGKIVLDVNNAVPARDGDVATVANAKGIGLASAGFLPGTRLVRGFNMLPSRVIASENHRTPEPIAIPLAGDDRGALDVIAGLVRDAGFEPVIVGPLSTATKFAMGSPVYLQPLGPRELRERLGLPPQ